MFDQAVPKTMLESHNITNICSLQYIFHFLASQRIVQIIQNLTRGLEQKEKKKIIVLLCSTHLRDFSENIIKTNEFKHSISIMDSTDPH